MNGREDPASRFNTAVIKNQCVYPLHFTVGYSFPEGGGQKRGERWAAQRPELGKNVVLPKVNLRVGLPCVRGLTLV